MQQWIDDWGKAAGSITAILGLAALCINPIRKRLKDRKAAQALAVREQQAFRTELKKALEELNEKLCALSEDIGDMPYLLMKSSAALNLT